MKLGILTQPLYHNYGGLLQAYALQKVLKDLGHEVLTINRIDTPLTSGFKLKQKIKQIIKKILLKQNALIRVIPTDKEYLEIRKYTNRFIKENISLTDVIDSSKKMSLLDKYKFEGLVVGSDQCWRPKYSPDIYSYFLDFAEDKKNIKRISYAASFGVDSWEFSETETNKCAALIKKFDTVSVRESSGQELCEKHLGVDATLVLDPTMMLDKTDYIELVSNKDIQEKNNSLMVYVLDYSKEKYNLVNTVSNKLKLEINSVKPKHLFTDIEKESLRDCIYPPVEQWIKGFIDADYVVTDSFHGTVFSILFNKPFIVIGNKERGFSRFQSLLKMFDLESRLVSSYENLDIDLLLNENINFDKVNEIMKEMKEDSLKFILNSLN